MKTGAGMTHLAEKVEARQEKSAVFAVAGFAFPFQDRAVEISAKKPPA